MRPVIRWLMIAVIPIAAMLGVVGGSQSLPAFAAPAPPATVDPMPPVVGVPPIGNVDTIRDGLKSLPADHPWAKFTLDQAAAAKPPYGDFGQWAAMAYVMSGDSKYALASADRLLKACSPDPADANTVREYFFEWCLLYERLKPALDKERDAALRKALARVCEWCFAIDTPKYKGGWRYSDSDQTAGQVFGLMMADKVLGTKWTERAEWSKGKEAVLGYIKSSAGGEWCESSLYNLGTLKILLTAAPAVGFDLGDFPDQVASQLLASLTPDGKDSVQWGDVQDARRAVVIDRWAPLLYILYGLTGRADVYAAFERMTTGVPTKKWLNLGWRALYFYRPPPKPATPKDRVAVPTPLRVSTGNGHLRYKRDDSLVAAHFPARLSLDHEVTYPCDVQWWHKGEWVLTRPLGYGATAVGPMAANSVLLAGLSGMHARGLIESGKTAEGFTVTGGTSGPRYGPDPATDKPYYNPPPPFLDFHKRTVTYTHPGRLEVKDVFKGTDPKASKLDRYRAADQAAIKAAPALWQQVWHCPVKPTETKAGFEWKTAGGQVVKLTAPAGVKRTLLAETDVLPKAQFVAAELGGYQIRFLSDEPSCEMVTTIEVN